MEDVSGVIIGDIHVPVSFHAKDGKRLNLSTVWLDPDNDPLGAQANNYAKANFPLEYLSGIEVRFY
jgi:hypothetical protein